MIVSALEWGRGGGGGWRDRRGPLDHKGRFAHLQTLSRAEFKFFPPLMLYHLFINKLHWLDFQDAQY